MQRFSDITYHGEEQLADVGAGLDWGEVYTGMVSSSRDCGRWALTFDLIDLQQYNVTVAGGRDYGVGVGGLSLIGGTWASFPSVGYIVSSISTFSFVGWSWLTQAHGLTVDNIVGYELVLPNGDLTEVTEEDQPDLFFALKVRLSSHSYVQG